MFDQGLIESLVSQKNYFADQDAVRDLRHRAIAMSHRHHYHNNAFYRENCQVKGVGERVSPADFPRIVIPDDVFKSYEMDYPEQAPEAFLQWLSRITSVPINLAPKRTGSLEEMLAMYERSGLFLGFSSGTTGKLTFLPRDETTRSMIVRSYVEAVDATVKVNRGRDRFVLGIPRKTYLQVGYNGRVTAEALSPGNVYYAFDDLRSDMIRTRMRGPKNWKERGSNALVKKLMPSMEKNAIRKIVGELGKTRRSRVIFMAPPFLLVDTARYVLDHGIDCRLDEASILASTGGFKGRKKTSREEINRLILEAFGVQPDRYIDLYGMTEANSIMVECTQAGRKHVPPWMELILFDERMEPLEPKGRVTGRYAFLEPSSRSFPGFIVTGDRLTVDYEGCSCGRRTPVLVSIERAPRAEGRGCSGVLSQTVGDVQ